VYHHRFGDRERAREWFVSGLELDSSFEWDVAEMAPTDPLRGVFDELRGQSESEPAAVEGVELVVPDGSALRLDGRPLTVAAATTGRPHVLQVVNQTDAQQAQSILIEGNALPERFLQVIAVAEAATSDKKRRSERNEHTPTDDLSVVTVRRVRPAAKTPLMVSGAVLMLGAGGIYGASFGARAKFDAATTTADLERYRNLTNTLVVASAATLAAGVSVEYAGVLLGAGPGGARVGWTRSF
jgi:hypothetical protein